jgi:hypothetical protein
VMTSAGRSSLRVVDLLELVAVIEQHRTAQKSKRANRQGARCVKQMMP